MRKLAFFIDGFNLYHAIKDNKNMHKYKWLDLAKLCRSFCRADDVIQEIFYFTAYATFKPEGMERHKTYVRVLESKGVKPIFGEFKRKEKFCFTCKKYTQSYEEKKTDVNIAIKLFQTAIHGLYDMAFIISGDSDLIPAIQAVKETFPDKTVGVIIPIGRRAEALKQAAHFHMKMKQRHLETCQLPDRVELDGKTIMRPDRWK
jgi:uncharacterized LabA/DUF88 family protein